MGNIYFELTEEFNDAGLVALLASGQAVVFHRLAIMSKDGDWILRETQEACRRVLEVLSARGARYRPGAPLHTSWLAGDWWTTDPDRVLAQGRRGGARRETDALQRADAARLARYERAAAGYLAAFREPGLGERPLPGAHDEVVALAEQFLPKEV